MFGGIKALVKYSSRSAHFRNVVLALSPVFQICKCEFLLNFLKNYHNPMLFQKESFPFSDFHLSISYHFYFWKVFF